MTASMDRARKRVATINYIERLTGRSYPSNLSKNIFFIGLILAASGLVSPPIALAGGLIYAFSFVHPFHVDAKKLSKLLLQESVVGLGFSMDLQQVLQTGRPGFIYTAASISMALLLGWGLGRLLRVKQRISFLISAGTAICTTCSIFGLMSGAGKRPRAMSSSFAMPTIL